MSEPSEPVNPYAPPQAVETASDAAAEPWLGTYQPRLAPRDAVDVALLLGIGVPGAVLVYGMPLALIAWLGAPVVLVPICVMGVLGAALIAVSCGIQKLTVTPQGLVARRGILPAVEMDWLDVVEVRELSRREALRESFFSPHRYCSHSLSYRGHVRIATLRKYIVFPPQNAATFLATIAALCDERCSIADRATATG